MNFNNHLFSVSELNNVIKSILESSFFEINLEGEISNFRPASSGHWYFSLRDRDSIISAVMFRGAASGVNFNPTDGMKVKVRGKLSLYPQRGTYQILCNSMSLYGEGDILLMLEERKKRLSALGYFDSSIKKDIPRFPRKIAVITSPTGAALQDFLKVINRRGCLSNIIIYPTLVQGLEAASGIIKQIKKVNSRKNCDLIVITRGGGSIEDLLPFSDEGVVKEIFNSSIPIISAVGHEIDTSLSDLAADLRVATPSAAGEIVTEGTSNLINQIQGYKKDLSHTIKSRLLTIRSKLTIFNKETVKSVLQSKIDGLTIHVDSLKNSIVQNQIKVILRDKNRLKNSINILNSISPYELFNKGYSWVSIDGKSISKCKVNKGDKIDIKYLNGCLKGEVLNKE